MAKKRKQGAGKRSGGLEEADKGTTLKVTVGGYSPNKKGGHSITFGAPLQQIKPNAAHALLAGSQIRVNLECDPNSSRDVKGQERLGDLGDSEVGPITFVATCSGVGMTLDRLRFSLSAPSVPAEEIAPFAFKEANLRLTRIGDKPTAREKPNEVPDPEQQTLP